VMFINIVMGLRAVQGGSALLNGAVFIWNNEEVLTKLMAQMRDECIAEWTCCTSIYPWPVGAQRARHFDISYI
jgi:hypothetical protein